MIALDVLLGSCQSVSAYISGRECLRFQVLHQSLGAARWSVFRRERGLHRCAGVDRSVDLVSTDIGCEPAGIENDHDIVLLETFSAAQQDMPADQT